jgi:hypothetical protein
VPWTPALPGPLAALAETARAIALRSGSARLLREGGEPMPRKAVEAALRDAWGQAPGKVLDDLEDAPVRWDAVAQVHRAERDGEPVAVEVQRPGAARTIRDDLVLLDALAAPAAAAFPRVDVRGLMREARERVLDDLDLEHVGSVQRAVGRAARRDERVLVPAVDTELTTEAVLVSARADGDAPGAEHAASLLQASLALAARDGWVLVDHRPEHVRVTADGRLALLAAGRAVRLDRDRVALFAAALRGLHSGDPAPIAALGVVTDDAAPEAVRIAREAAAPFLGGPARLDLEAVEAVARRAEAAGAFGLAPAATPQPQDLWPGRGLGQLVLTLAVLGATEDWPALAEEALAAR